MNQFKIVVLGDGEVGKTTWAHRLLTRGEFLNEYVPTLGVEVHPLRYRINGEDPIGFNIWDCAGVERFGGLRDGYYIQAKGAILMCDLTRSDTCEALMRWKRDLDRVCENIPIVVCGNKVDREDRVFNLEEGEREGITYCTMSVGNAHNLKEPLILLARKLLEREDVEELVEL